MSDTTEVRVWERRPHWLTLFAIDGLIEVMWHDRFLWFGFTGAPRPVGAILGRLEVYWGRWAGRYTSPTRRQAFREVLGRSRPRGESPMSDCLYPDPAGGMTRDKHIYGGEGYCVVCGEKVKGDTRGD